jgi:hypothetical protein
MSEQATSRQVCLDRWIQVRQRLGCKDGSSDRVLDRKALALHAFGSRRCLSIGTDEVGRHSRRPERLSPGRPKHSRLSPADAGDALSLSYITAVSSLQQFFPGILLVTSHLEIFGTLALRKNITITHLPSFPAHPT